MLTRMVVSRSSRCSFISFPQYLLGDFIDSVSFQGLPVSWCLLSRNYWLTWQWCLSSSSLSAVYQSLVCESMDHRAILVWSQIMPENLMAIYWEIWVTDKSSRGNTRSEDFAEKACHCKLAINNMECVSLKHLVYSKAARGNTRKKAKSTSKNKKENRPGRKEQGQILRTP